MGSTLQPLWQRGNFMRAEVFIDQSQGGVAEISVVKHAGTATRRDPDDLVFASVV